GFGPLHLPQPDQMPLDPRPRFAVAHYLTEPTIYRKWFFPQLDNALGPLWPLILIVAVTAAVYVAFRSRNVILRVTAVGALATAVAYTSTALPDPRRVAADGARPERPAAADARPAGVAGPRLPPRQLGAHSADDAALVPRL